MLSGDDIRRIRQELGWSQRKLARKLGYDHGHGNISKLETGKRRCKTVFSLALLYLAQKTRQRKVRHEYAKMVRRERALVLSETVTPELSEEQMYRWIDDNDGSRSR